MGAAIMTFRLIWLDPLSTVEQRLLCSQDQTPDSIVACERRAISVRADRDHYAYDLRKAEVAEQ